MEGITGWEFKEVWLKGKLELERYVIGHSWDFVLPLTPHPMHYEQFTGFDSFCCSFYVDLTDYEFPSVLKHKCHTGLSL